MENEFGRRPGFIFLDSIEDIRWYVNLDDYFEINPKFENHARIKRWCEENCKDTVAYLVLYTDKLFQNNDSSKVRRSPSLCDRIYFFEESDMVAFKLRWHDAIV